MCKSLENNCSHLGPSNECMAMKNGRPKKPDLATIDNKNLKCPAIDDTQANDCSGYIAVGAIIFDYVM